MKLLTALIMVLALTALMGTGSAVTISGCTDLNSADTTYYLTADITNSVYDKCMNITANNVTLDCQGHTIDGISASPSTYGIQTKMNYTTIINCNLREWNMGVDLDFTHYANVTNTTSYDNVLLGIRIGFGNYDVVDNCTTYNSTYGIFIYTNEYNNVTNCVSYNNSYGFWSTQNKAMHAYNNKMYNNSLYGWYLEDEGIAAPCTIYNNFFNNTANIYLPATAPDNYWNTTLQNGTRIHGYGNLIGGNFYAYPNGTGYSETCTDSDKNGICDVNLTVGYDNYDDHPLSDEYPPPVQITINHPVNASIDSDLFNVTFSETANWSAYSLNGASNVSMGAVSTYETTLAGLSNGYNYMTVYANNSIGDMSSLYRGWTRDVDSERGPSTTIADGGVGDPLFWPNQRAICRTSDNALHAVWRSGISEVMHGMSSDNGTTWSNNVLYAGFVSKTPHIDCHGVNISVAFEVSSTIYFSRSNDSGSSWSTASTGIGSTIEDIIVHEKGGVLYMAHWNSGNTINLMNSTDSGTSWSTPVAIMTPGFKYPTFAVDGNGTSTDKLYVFAVNDTDKSKYFRKSTDGGATWGSYIKVFDNATVGGNTNLGNGAVVYNGNTISVVAGCVGNDTVLFSQTTDGGSTWSSQLEISSQPNLNKSSNPMITMNNNNNNLYVFWMTNQYHSTWDIQYRKYSDGVWHDIVNVTDDADYNGFPQIPETFDNNWLDFVWQYGGGPDYYNARYSYYLFSGDPSYSGNSTNSTVAGTDILHSLQWTDASGLSGYIFQFCNGTWNGADCGSGTDIELKESYTTNDDTQGAIYNTAWWGQTFNASASYDIKKVGVKVFKVGNPGDVSISIYPTNATGHPDTTGAPLVTGTFNGNVITTSSPGEWVNTTFDSAYALTYGTTYAIVMNLTGSVSNYMDWRLDTTSATYSGGTKASSNNAGTVWNLGVGDDMMFETYSESGTDWVNDSWSAMTGTTNWSNVTKSVNTTSGANIAWAVYANDTSDNWNTSATYSYLTTTAPIPPAGIVTIEPGVIFDPSSSDTNYTFYSQYEVTTISVNSTHIEIDGAMLKAEPDTGTVNCTIYDYGTTGDHYRAFNITNTSETVSTGWCYQETATTATTCGGLDSGGYANLPDSGGWNNPPNIYDENWNSYASPCGSATMGINYTIPGNAKDTSVWEVKYDDWTEPVTHENLTLDAACFYDDILRLKIHATQTSGINSWWYCYNSTDWVLLRSGYRRIYEEAMNWDSDATAVTITQGGYVLDDSLLIWRNKVRDGVAQLANATGFISITQTLSTYNITSYIGTTEPVITAYKLFTYGVYHNMTQLRDIYANITFYDTTTPAETFYINTTWYKTNTTGTYTLDSCCDTANQTALNNTATVITIPCWSNQTTVADNISAQMTVVDSAGKTASTNATGTVVSHWWENWWDQQENW